MSGFATLIPDARAFLGKLARNNTKAWWDDNKAIYDTQLKAPAHALIDKVSADLAALTDLPIKGKLFRPHRDVRFSKDKTPYKTHLHMMWTAQTGARQDVSFFFGIGLDDVRAGGGIMGFDKAVLEDWRLFVEQDHKRILKITEGMKAQSFDFWEPALKRVPSGYDKDHPAGALLRMKNCVTFKDVAGTDDIGPTFKALWPLNQLLIQIVEA